MKANRIILSTLLLATCLCAGAQNRFSGYYKDIFMDGGVIVEEGKPEDVFGDTKQDRTKQFLQNYNQ